EPDTDEATQRQLHLARAQGDAYGDALEHMTTVVADDGDQQRAGEYWIGYAVEEAEGMYEWQDGELVWREPGTADLHVEVTVRDAGDGRFVPCARVLVTVIDPDGRELGTHEQPLLWHPMIYHYGRNWATTANGRYRLRVRVEPPTFMRHDQVNGLRFAEPVEVEFSEVDVRLTRA
ncbi:MAG TPA: iron transporter, partial [Solirubrobacteraceae bacterium]|nr:iron transporter [Solirubrobacteraceae bacterium]